jgi:hypothetical protein
VIIMPVYVSNIKLPQILAGVSQFRGAIRDKIAPSFARHYGFVKGYDTDVITSNKQLYEGLKHKRTFICKVGLILIQLSSRTALPAYLTVL